MSAEAGPGLQIVGYTDRLSAAPGDTVRFMVSCEVASYDVRLVRLVHGDTNPAGPGFKQVVVPSAIDGEREGARHVIRTGSFAELPLGEADLSKGWTFAVFVQPTNLGAGVQTIASMGVPAGGHGWALSLATDGCLELAVGDGSEAVRHATGVRLHRWEWSFVAAALGGGRATVWHRSVRALPVDPGTTVSVPVGTVAPTPGGMLVLAASRGADGAMSQHMDGRLDRPRLFARALRADEILRLSAQPDELAGLAADLAGSWDFSREIGTDRVVDTVASGISGRVVNMPTRGVTGHNFSGRETTFRLAPEEYGAIHFHRDDLEDAGWPVAFELTIPPDLPSGMYAAWLRAGDVEDHLPFTVRPARGAARARIAMLVSSLTYVMYGNFTDIGVTAWRDPPSPGTLSDRPLAEVTAFRDVYAYIEENRLLGPYDVHADGSGICYGSSLRPLLNVRPKFRYRTMNCPARFAADLYIVDWLDRIGVEVDFVTDHDLHDEGESLLRPYAVVVSSTHPEYWTGPMLCSLESYLTGGGRFMYLGGNGLFGVTSIDPERPHCVEVRRWGTSWPFEMPPAERYHSTTGEPGGTWRNRGRAPNTIVGVGTAGAGFDRGSPYRRMPDSYDPRASWIFDGVDGDLIGDQPNLQVKWGASGYEFDRVDFELGSPSTTLTLASSVRFNASHTSMIDDDLTFMQGRDGRRTGDPHEPGAPHRFVRSDLAYLEYPNGGAVFSVGAICWAGALSAYDYRNPVSRVTENVLRRFADPHWPEPSSEPSRSVEGVA